MHKVLAIYSVIQKGFIKGIFCDKWSNVKLDTVDKVNNELRDVIIETYPIVNYKCVLPVGDFSLTACLVKSVMKEHHTNV